MDRTNPPRGGEKKFRRKTKEPEFREEFRLWKCLKLLRWLLATCHHDLAGADGFNDLELGEHADRGVELRAVAVDHDDHRCRREVDGLAAEVFGDLEGL